MAWTLTIDLTLDQVDAVSDRLWELGTDGVAELPGPQLIAGFPTSEAACAARSILGGEVRAVDPTQWQTPAARSVAVGEHSLVIDAGHSFGHGDHPTTQLCLRALERHVRPSMSVLDVGSGSGVLAIAARALGADPVVAIDIDPAAVEATQRNATENNVRVEISSTPVASVGRTFDLVVVNMLVAELEPIAADVSVTAHDLLVLTGALVDQADRWGRLFPEHRAIEQRLDADWAGRVCQRVDRG